MGSICCGIMAAIYIMVKNGMLLYVLVGCVGILTF